MRRASLFLRRYSQALDWRSQVHMTQPHTRHPKAWPWGVERLMVGNGTTAPRIIRTWVLERADRAYDSLTLVLGEALGEGDERWRHAPQATCPQVDYSSFLH